MLWSITSALHSCQIWQSFSTSFQSQQQIEITEHAQLHIQLRFNYMHKVTIINKMLNKKHWKWAYWTPSLLLSRFLYLYAPPPVTFMNLSLDSSAEQTRCCWIKSTHVSIYFVSNLIKCSRSLNSSSSDMWYISPPAAWQIGQHRNIHVSNAQHCQNWRHQCVQ